MFTTKIRRNAKRSTAGRPKIIIAAYFGSKVLVFVIVAGALMLSPGRPAPVVDENGKPVPGSLSEKVFVNINGARQGMFIQSRDPSLPVLLFVHGGMPEYFLTKKYPTGLENLFTVVWWEQRGCGISYNDDIPAGAITSEQLIADTLEVTNYLRERFGQEKIYLMGHSGGTFIALQAAARAPELYHAYVGAEQITNQLESEVLAYEYMLQQYKELGNNNMVQKLEADPVTLDGGVPTGYLQLRDTAMHRLGIGTTHLMRSVITGVFLPSLGERGYTILEKINLWRAKSQTGVSVLWNEMQTTDLSDLVTELEIPVYFFHGRYDYTVSYPLARAYFESLQAPVKGFYSFENSAHSPMFEEPEKVRQIMLTDVRGGGNQLAD